MEERDPERAKGIACILAVYLIWGVLPAYWKLMKGIDPLVILAHRALWAFVLLVAALGILYGRKRILADLADRKVLGLHLLSSLALAVQWAAYMIAIVTDRLVEMSIGYYIYPILVVFLAIPFGGERTTRVQKVALALASAGVVVSVVRYRGVPVIALVLALSFSAYSLVKKRVRINPMNSTFYEMLFLLPFAVVAAGLAEAKGPGPFLGSGAGAALLLVGGGVATASSLLLFAAGARRIPIFTVGFLQYISPTIVLAIGVFGYGESFGVEAWIVFGFIWLSLIVSSAPQVRAFLGRRGGGKAD